jgi:hypothetical protein
MLLGVFGERAVDWRERAACLGEDTELFFPAGLTGRALEQIEQAKVVCRGCAVVIQCLEGWVGRVARCLLGRSFSTRPPVELDMTVSRSSGSLVINPCGMRLAARCGCARGRLGRSRGSCVAVLPLAWPTPVVVGWVC